MQLINNLKHSIGTLKPEFTKWRHILYISSGILWTKIKTTLPVVKKTPGSMLFLGRA